MSLRRYYILLDVVALLILFSSVIPGAQVVIAQAGITQPLLFTDENPPQEPITDADTQSEEQYAKAFSVSIEEAQKRLHLQDEMGKLQTQVIQGEPSYAGSWVQHEPAFGLVFAFASPNGAEIIRKYLDGIEWADLVKVQESPYTIPELLEIHTKVTKAANNTGVPFEPAADPMTAKIILYSPEPNKLQDELIARGEVKDNLSDITYVKRELSVPFGLSYPYLMGGAPLAGPVQGCTTGFAVKRNSDGRRFIVTAGHCENDLNVIYNATPSVYLGPVVYEQDNDLADIQMHDVSVRSFDLTNHILTSANK